MSDFEEQAVSFALQSPGPRFRLHLVLLVVLVHAVCDLFKGVFKRVGNFADKMHKKMGGKEPEKLTLKDAADLSKVFKKENMTPFRLLKGVTVVLVFLSEFLLPYYLFNKTTKVLRTNFERQVHSYSPLTLVHCRPPRSARDFLLPKKELERLMEEELDREQKFSLNMFEFFENLSDLDDDSNEEVQRRLDEQLAKDTKKMKEKTKQPNKNEVFNLSSFNRFVAFTLSKAALHGLYVTFHALFSPHNHNAFLESFKKKR